MSKRLLVINGHPDPRPERFCAALCDAYAKGAAQAGWEVERLDLGLLSFAPAQDASATEMLGRAEALDKIHRADRLAIVFPLWLDKPPGPLNEIFELAARNAWSSEVRKSDAYEKPARVIVTMDMPAFIQRPRSRSEGPTRAVISLPAVKSFEPIYVGSVQTLSKAQREQWLEKIQLLGAHEE